MVYSPKKLKPSTATTTTNIPILSLSPSKNILNHNAKSNQQQQQQQHSNHSSTFKTYLNSILIVTFNKSSLTKLNQIRLIVVLLFLTSLSLFYSNLINSSTTTSSIQEQEEQTIIELDPFPIPRPKPILPQNRYITYLPHSGFHNQRIALENALTLAYTLNRTLLIPPCFFGTPIPYISSDKLTHRLTTAQSKLGLEHCHQQKTSQSVLSRECLGSNNGITTIGWDQIINLKSISNIISIQDLPKGIYEANLLAKELKLNPKEDLYNLKDFKVYDYKYLISNEIPIQFDQTGLGKFGKWINVREEFEKDLRVSSKGLVCLGSLFGTSRIKIDHHHPDSEQQDLMKTRRLIRKAMLPEDSINGILKRRSREIIKSLGGHDQYWSVHIRLGDSIFRSESHLRAMKALEGLVTGPMNLTISELNQAIQNDQHRIQSNRHLPQKKCRGSLHKPSLGLEKFNQILYIATDSPIPTSESSLIPFFKAFPCIYILNDLGLGEELNRLVNLIDKISLGPFFAPLLDAMVSGHSKGVVGTEGSTFSRFVVDLLFPMYHDLPIIERG